MPWAHWATSKDLKTFHKEGIITPQVPFIEFIHLAKSRKKINPKYERMNAHVPVHEHVPDHLHNHLLLWDKNVMFFPRRINGKLCMLHRIKPDIQMVCFEKLEDLTPAFWQHYFIHLKEHIAIDCRYDHESSYVGGGAPPIETEHGWLIIYHSVRDTVKGYVYSACAAPARPGKPAGNCPPSLLPV